MTDRIRELLGLDQRDIEDILDRIRRDAPSLDRLLPAMLAFADAAADTDPDALYADTYDLRRSHLAVLVAVAEHTRARFADLLADMALDDRVGTDTATPLHDGMHSAGEALTKAAHELRSPPTRNR